MLAWGGRRIGPLTVAEGALPPAPLLLDAFHRMEAGGDGFWIAPWLFVDTVSKAVVGSGGFKGEPQQGRVEIGYGVAEAARNLGVASCAVCQLTERALANRQVQVVYAESRIDNVPSRRVLEKSGFVHIGRRESDEDGPVDCWQRARGDRDAEAAGL